MVNPHITAAEAVTNARTLWENAGGIEVDAFYADYYANAGDSALRMSDFEQMKAVPRLTEAVQAVYDRLTK